MTNDEIVAAISALSDHPVGALIALLIAAQNGDVEAQNRIAAIASALSASTSVGSSATTASTTGP